MKKQYWKREMIMSDQQTVDFLEHFGVRGMRWGSRKAQTSGGARSGSGKKPNRKRTT